MPFERELGRSECFLAFFSQLEKANKVSMRGMAGRTEVVVLDPSGPSNNFSHVGASSWFRSQRLGNLRLVSIALPKRLRSICASDNLDLAISPDCIVWLCPTIITLILAGGGLAIVHDDLHFLEMLAFVALVFIALTLSFLNTVSDPGVYVTNGDDPLKGDTSLFLCKICQHRRPPRTSHCYVCGVCVLEHDHHCGIVGGCVGLRTLRLFVGYLFFISIASVLLDMYLLRFIFYSSMALDRHGSMVPQAALGIVLSIFVSAIVLSVGGMAFYYLFLVATDTLRREAQGKLYKQGKAKDSCVIHCRRFLCPPPSMIFAFHSASGDASRGGSGPRPGIRTDEEKLLFV